MTFTSKLSQDKKLLAKSRASLQSRFDWLVSKFMRHLWVRTSVYAVLGIALALSSLWLKNLIPAFLHAQVSNTAVSLLLSIVASSMLSVIIFSLSTIVTAFGSQNSNATPRATILLAENSTVLNTLAVFLGAFVYSLTALFVLNFARDDNNLRVVLYFTTLMIVALIIVTLVRWIEYALRLARISATTSRLEKETRRALQERCDNPFLGGTYWSGLPQDLPPEVKPVFIHELAYIQHIDVTALDKLTSTYDIKIYVNLIPGNLVHDALPLAHIHALKKHTKEEIEEITQKIISAFSVGAERSFDHDPRFGLCALSEIGCKAFKATGDPGTVIDVLDRAGRILGHGKPLFDKQVKHQKAPYTNVFVTGLTADSLFDDAFNAISRDGANQLEVIIHLQKILFYLASLGNSDYHACAKEYSRITLDRSLKSTNDRADHKRSRHAASLLLKPAPPHKKAKTRRAKSMSRIAK